MTISERSIDLSNIAIHKEGLCQFCGENERVNGSHWCRSCRQFIKKRGGFTLVALFDAHLSSSKPTHPSYELAKKFIRDFQPDQLVLGGDFCEMTPLCHWLENKQRLMENERYEDDLEFIYGELAWFNKKVRGARKVYIEGNHEWWAKLYIDHKPHLEGFLDYPKNLGLSDLGWDWVPDNGIYQVGHLNIIHGWYTNKYHAAKHLDEMGDGNVLYGHVHREQSFSKKARASMNVYKAQSVGCLCGMNPYFMRGKPNNWLNGFAIVCFRPDGTFQLDHVVIVDNQCTWGGKTWKLKS